MTVQELAESLNGREYGSEVSPEDRRLAKESGLVIVYGYSDDCAELDGAIQDEAGCFDGGTFLITKTGVMREPDCGYNRCDYFVTATKSAKKIRALWCAPEAEAPWTYETDIPHETFDIYEDGELYCVGIVFRLEDV